MLTDNISYSYNANLAIELGHSPSGWTPKLDKPVSRNVCMNCGAHMDIRWTDLQQAGDNGLVRAIGPMYSARCTKAERENKANVLQSPEMQAEMRSQWDKLRMREAEVAEMELEQNMNIYGTNDPPEGRRPQRVPLMGKVPEFVDPDDWVPDNLGQYVRGSRPPDKEPERVAQPRERFAHLDLE